MSDQRNLFETDTTNVEEMGFPVMKAGKYPAIMISAIKEPTKASVGMDVRSPSWEGFIKCVYQFFECEYEGRQYTSRLNIWNSNSTAVEIAKKEVGALRKALSLSPTEGDPEKYLRRPLVLEMGVKNKKISGVVTAELENVLKNIEAYVNASHAEHPHPQQQYQPQQPAPQQQNHAYNPSASKKPWDRSR